MPNKNITNVLAVAEKHGAKMPAALVKQTEAVARISIPRVNYNALVAEVAAAVTSPAFDAKVTDALDALARDHAAFGNDVKRYAERDLNAAWFADAEAVVKPFSGVISKHLGVLNAKAGSLPRTTNRHKAIDLDIDRLIVFREVEAAYDALLDIAQAIKPWYGVAGHSIRGGLFDALVFTAMPQQFDTIGNAVEMRNALAGRREEFSHEMSSQRSNELVFVPSAVAAASPLSTPFEFALPSSYVERCERLEESLTPRAYKDEYDDAGLYEGKPRGLIL